MFAFFERKLTTKCDRKIRHLFWGDPEEGLVFSGDSGVLTLLDTKTLLADESSCPDVVPNCGHEERKFPDFQTLTCPEKDPGTVRVVRWNSVNNRPVTIDDSGCFAVWKLDKKAWVKEELCFNAFKGLKDCTLSPDERKICILCSDGRLCLCTMDGQKLWSKELKRRMRHVLWSPTGLELLLCSEAGELFFYDSEGFYTHSLHYQRRGNGQETTCATLVPVADVDWYMGDRQLNLDPALAIAYENGCVEVYVGDIENEPLKFDVHLVQCTAALWRPTGHVLAVLGRSRVLHPLVRGRRQLDEKADFIIRFCSSRGMLLHTLVLPEGRPAEAFSWNRRGDKIVVASGYTLLFAKIRPKYASAYFAGTVVYTSPSSEAGKQLLWFWNTDNQGKHVRVVDKVLHIQAAVEGCLVVTEEHSCEKQQELASATARYALTIYSSSGDAKKVFRSQLTPDHIAFTGGHVIAADSRALSIWVYNLPPTESRPFSEGGIQTENAHRRSLSARWSSGQETSPHMRTTAAALSEAVTESCSIQGTAEQVHPKTHIVSDAEDADPIVALTANARCFIVAKKWGELRRYSLPSVELHYKYNLSSPPLTVQINSDGSRLAVVDVLRVLRLYDAAQPTRNGTSAFEDRTMDTLYEREDVEHILWASDHPDCFAIRQKNVFYIARGTTMEEVVKCSAHLLEYRDLSIRGVYFDKLSILPSSPRTSHLYEFRTKPLRDTKAILQNPRNLQDGLTYVDQRPHPTLWRLLAMAALQALNLAIAGDAYVKCQDYFGLLFLKYLSTMDSSERQMAEVSAYSGNVDEAVRLYMSAGRMDLALASKTNAGEWSGVLAMCRQLGCGPKPIQDALSELADCYSESCCWFEAIEIYRQLQNRSSLARALYATEQYEEMYNMVAGLASGDAVLLYIGRRLESVGMCDEAVNTFRKAGHFKVADEVCVKFKESDDARRPPEDNFAQRENGILTTVAERLRRHNRINHVIELQQGGSDSQEALTALLQAAISAKLAGLPSNPVKAKMVYVLGGLLVEVGPKKLTKHQRCLSDASDACLKSPSLKRWLKPKEGTTSAQDRNIWREFQDGTRRGSSRCNDDEAATCWRGAEAYHLFLLYHQHMAKKRFSDAVCTAERLVEYSEYVTPYAVYTMLALAGYYAQSWRVCSAALMRLESFQGIPVQQKAYIANLAVDVFSRYCPAAFEPDDPAAPLCPRCQARLQNWDTMCQECGASFPFCVGSGRPIFAPRVTGSGNAPFFAANKSDVVHPRLRDQGGDVFTCCTCRRQMFATVAGAVGYCPLCHTSFRASATVTEYRCHVEYQTCPKNVSCAQNQKE